MRTPHPIRSQRQRNKKRSHEITSAFQAPAAFYFALAIATLLDKPDKPLWQVMQDAADGPVDLVFA